MGDKQDLIGTSLEVWPGTNGYVGMKLTDSSSNLLGYWHVVASEDVEDSDGNTWSALTDYWSLGGAAFPDKSELNVAATFRTYETDVKFWSPVTPAQCASGPRVYFTPGASRQTYTIDYSGGVILYEIWKTMTSDGSQKLWAYVVVTPGDGVTVAPSFDWYIYQDRTDMRISGPESYTLQFKKATPATVKAFDVQTQTLKFSTT